MKDNLCGLTLQEISVIVKKINTQPFVAKQICDWIYKKDIDDIDKMTNISINVRNILSKLYTINTISYIQTVISKDSTRKYLFQYADNTFVEAVLIFDKKRCTLCISTQAGCRMNCKFCATGKQGLKRNLTSFEIINIFRVLDREYKINNIVFMGMGEPLDNWNEVQKTIEILTSDWAYAISPHRITVSTAGYIPKLKEFLDFTQVDVAISLHNAIEQERLLIMPIQKKYPIKDVVDILRKYDWTGQRHLTFEYILFKNFNDSQRHINAICKLLNGLSCRINLIRFHNVENTPFESADDNHINLFCQQLKNKGFNVIIRASKGEDIMAACGLLSTKYLQ